MVGVEEDQNQQQAPSSATLGALAGAVNMLEDAPAIQYCNTCAEYTKITDYFSLFAGPQSVLAWRQGAAITRQTWRQRQHRFKALRTGLKKAKHA